MRTLIFLFLLLWAAPIAAEDRPPVHVEIVLDSSGSMLDNDPGRLSSLAGMIFADLAAPGDLLGVQCMKKDGYTLQSLAPVEQARSRARERIQRLPFHGTTDCAGPLKVAARELEKARQNQKSAQQFVIFLSDGVCPRERPDEAQALLDAAEKLRNDGVRVFSIGLFDEAATQGKDPERDLQNMAAATHGEYFRATQASDLPRRFADILGRIVGSEAQPFAIEPGKATEVELDGYVQDASVIVTTHRRPVRVTRVTAPGGSSLNVPLKNPPFEVLESAFFESAGNNGKDGHYVVLRLNAPRAGTWKFIVDAPADATALVIQNYGLNPVMDLKPSYRAGQPAKIGLRLNGPEGQEIVDPGFMGKVVASARGTGPDGVIEVPLSVSPEGLLTGQFTPQKAGAWTFVGHVALKTGGLRKTTLPATTQAIDLQLALAADQGPIDFGRVKAGTASGDFLVDLGASQLVGAYELELKTGLAGVTVVPSKTSISPENKQVRVKFEVDEGHEGGAVEGQLTLGTSGVFVTVPLTGQVEPISFWERYGKLVIAILAALGLLALVLFVVRGIFGPHNFGPDTRINWGETVERLNKNSLVIREIRGTGSGFYRNARLVFGGPTSFAPADGAPLVTIEAVGPNRLEIRAEGGVELLAVNKFDHEKTKKVEGNTSPMSAGEIYKVGRFFVRVR